MSRRDGVNRDSARTESTGMYLAVLPKYRQECIDILLGSTSNPPRLFVSDAHLDSTVRTGILQSQYVEVGIRRLFGGRVFLQTGRLREAYQIDSLIVDLNPRSLTAWFLLLARNVFGRRTLVWGHISPQKGPDSKTATLRRLMRRLASGTISYTYNDRSRALEELPNQQVWVAANALYRRETIYPAYDSSQDMRNTILYVGRFEPAKKLSLLVRSFAKVVKEHPSVRLVLIGGGSEESLLRDLVSELGVNERVDFPGWIQDHGDLRPYFQRAFCTVSPGFAGLGLTQSLGFGVPMVVAKDERHSPEIELAFTGGVSWVASDDPESLATGLVQALMKHADLPNASYSTYIQQLYSAESMAEGLLSALDNHSSQEVK